MRTQAGTALSLSTFPAPEKLPVPFDSAQGTIRALSGVEAQFLSRQTAASGGVGCYSENAPDEFIGDVRALKAQTLSSELPKLSRLMLPYQTTL